MNRPIRFTFKKMLEKEGYTVFTAANFAEVKEHIQGHEFDAVISDILIPGTNGLDILKTIKENSADVPVIMITGDPNIFTAAEALRQGAYDYLSKPVNRQKLLQVTAKAVEKKWLTNERKRLAEENKAYQKNLEGKVRERTQELEELNFFINNIIESIPSIIITLDLEGCITMLSANALSLLGRQNKSEVIGKTYQYIFPQKLARDIDKIIQEKDWNISHECQLENGATIGYNVSLLLRNQQEVTGKVLVMRDISEKKKLENELIQSEKLATLGLLAGKIGHEMGNPLFGILGYAELPESKYPQEEDLKHIVKQALQLKKMTRDLLTFSKPKPPQIASIDINSILKETIKFLKEITGQIKYHEVIVEYSPCLPPVMGDEEQLKQVFMNLLINASQAMKGPPEQDTLKVTTALDQQEKKILVCIEDSGCGISPEDIDRIFSPFYTTKGEKGTGLGMTVVKEIISKHQGHIFVESRLGQGTKVRISLTVQQQQ